MSGEEKNSAKRVGVVVKRECKHQMTTLRLDSGSRLAIRSARGFEIWTVVNESSLASLCKNTQTRWASMD